MSWPFWFCTNRKVLWCQKASFFFLRYILRYWDFQSHSKLQSAPDRIWFEPWTSSGESSHIIILIRTNTISFDDNMRLLLPSAFSSRESSASGVKQRSHLESWSFQPSSVDEKLICARQGSIKRLLSAVIVPSQLWQCWGVEVSAWARSILALMLQRFHSCHRCIVLPISP